MSQKAQAKSGLLASCPEDFRPLQAYLQRAIELHEREGLVSYFCTHTVPFTTPPS